uniref:Uncharacterized protein n=1 Tax=mine drainage metagenome TaxID=410659 RepID=E6Q0V8_9ZZZZ
MVQIFLIVAVRVHIGIAIDRHRVLDLFFELLGGRRFGRIVLFLVAHAGPRFLVGVFRSAYAFERPAPRIVEGNASGAMFGTWAVRVSILKMHDASRTFVRRIAPKGRRYAVIDSPPPGLFHRSVDIALQYQDTSRVRTSRRLPTRALPIRTGARPHLDRSVRPTDRAGRSSDGGDGGPRPGRHIAR